MKLFGDEETDAEGSVFVFVDISHVWFRLELGASLEVPEQVLEQVLERSIFQIKKSLIDKDF